MPAARYQSRRRSSLAHLHIKASKYRAPRNVTFAQNITPATFNTPATTEGFADDAVTSALFPPSDIPRGPSRKRGKNRRRSQGYIPRPPNAFMLFRADFVKQKHVPGSIEPSHTSLSKIIGSTWKALPEEHKEVWQKLAAKEAALHKAMYPDYKYCPRPSKKKPKVKMDEYVDEEDEQHREDVRILLLEGLKGEELAQALEELKRSRSSSCTPSTLEGPGTQAPTPAPSLPPVSEASSSYIGGSPYVNDNAYLPPASYLRRPSSVPLPGNFPFQAGFPTFSFPRMPSMNFEGVGIPAQQQQQQLPIHLQRRPSSAQGAMTSRTWEAPFDTPAHHTFDTVPEDSGMFDPNFDSTAFPGQMTWSFDVPGTFPTGFDGMSIPPKEITISPLDPLPALDAGAHAPIPVEQSWLEPMDPLGAPLGMQQSMSSSMPASTYSASSGASTPPEFTPAELAGPLLWAPRPHRPYDWDSTAPTATQASAAPVKNEDAIAYDMGAGAHSAVDPLATYMDFNAYGADTNVDPNMMAPAVEFGTMGYGQADAYSQPFDHVEAQNWHNMYSMPTQDPVF